MACIGCVSTPQATLGGVTEPLAAGVPNGDAAGDTLELRNIADKLQPITEDLALILRTLSPSAMRGGYCDKYRDHRGFGLVWRGGAPGIRVYSIIDP